MIYLLVNQLRETLEDAGLWSYFQIVDQLAFRALAAASLAFFTVLLAGNRVIDFLRRKKIGDAGLSDVEALRQHTASKANVPTMGGVLIVGAVLLACLLLADFTQRYITYGLTIFVAFACIGGFDDWLKLTAASKPAASRQGLRSWEKLLFQLGFAMIIGVFLFRHGDSGADNDLAHVLNLPFQKTYEPQPLTSTFRVAENLFFLPLWLFVILAVLFIAGFSNAVNITDGMDGLAAGNAGIVAFALAILAFIAADRDTAQRLLVPYITESDELAVLACATAGACLGFLWWNCSPAKVFMGDTGSLALGALLAYLALVIRHEVTLLIMGAVFILEIASVVIQVGWFKYTRIRTGTGRRLFKVAPIHHHFHVSGWTEQQTVVRAWIVTSILVVLGLALIKLR